MKKIVLGVSAVALALVLGVSVVSAQTAVTTTTTTSTATFTRDLTIGSTGADVTALQAMLIAGGKLNIAAPTGYFGTMTKTALAAWQASVGITPASGYFGPLTRAYIASHNTTSTTTSTVPGCSAGAMFSATTGKPCSTTTTTSTNNSSLGGGEASLEDLNAKSGDDDDVEEGGKGDVAEFEFDVEDADIEIQRLDLSFESDATGSDEDEPWNTFDTITIMDADGEELASEDVSDEDDWLENDNEPYTFRFNNLDYTVNEGDKGMIKVQIEAQNGIDGLSSSNDITWTTSIRTDGLRGTDGEDIEQYIGDNSETVSFDITEEGGDDGLAVRRNSDDPDATTFQVEDDGSSDWYTIFSFDLDSDEDSGDIEIDQLPITISTSDRVGDVINGLILVIDGEEFDDYGAFTSPTGLTASTTFDIDKEFTISGGDRVKVEVKAEFKTASTSATYPDGATVTASVVGSDIEAEGADDVTVTGSATGDAHTLRVMGVDVNVKGKSSSDQANDVDGTDNDVATFYVDVEIEAFEQDVFIPRTGPLAFTYQIEDQTGAVVLASTTTATSSTITSTSGADTDGNYFVVNENDKETFRLQVTFNPIAANEGQQYRLQILTISYNDSAATPDTTYTAEPASDFETPYKLIVD